MLEKVLNYCTLFIICIKIILNSDFLLPVLVLIIIIAYLVNNALFKVLGYDQLKGLVMTHVPLGFVHHFINDRMHLAMYFFCSH